MHDGFGDHCADLRESALGCPVFSAVQGLGAVSRSPVHSGLIRYGPLGCPHDEMARLFYDRVLPAVPAEGRAAVNPAWPAAMTEQPCPQGGPGLRVCFRIRTGRAGSAGRAWLGQGPLARWFHVEGPGQRQAKPAAPARRDGASRAPCGVTALERCPTSPCARFLAGSRG